jgi:fused signal recognition particle receptor
MFDFIKKNLQKIYTSITSNLISIFSQPKISPEILHEIEKILISADTGITTTQTIIDSLQRQYAQGTITTGTQLQQALEQELFSILNQAKSDHNYSAVYLLVGINGSGKTTFAGKLAHFFTSQGKSCILAAADTFRAAAPQQLESWATSSKAQLWMGKPNQDPAAVVFGACQAFLENKTEVLIIDTAGRLQTKEHLMREITKIKQVIEKQIPHTKIHTLLTVDAMLGQNSFAQAEVFHQAIVLDGIVLTKFDGTGKGGIIFSIIQKLKIPVEFISFGEHIDNMKKFDGPEYVKNLLGSFTKASDLHEKNH